LRILSWNIGRGRDPARIAATIATIAPDIACLQEVDWGCRRTGRCDVLKVLAERTGMLGLFGVEFIELDTPRRPKRLAGGGVTGNALLCRVQPRSVFRTELPEALDWQHGGADPSLPWRVRRAVRREPRIGGRFALGATFECGSATLTVCSVHLEDKFGGVASRVAQFRSLLNARLRDDAACVVAGDLNTFNSPLTRLVRPDTTARALGKPYRTTEAAW